MRNAADTEATNTNQNGTNLTPQEWEDIQHLIGNEPSLAFSRITNHLDDQAHAEAHGARKTAEKAVLAGQDPELAADAATRAGMIAAFQLSVSYTGEHPHTTWRRILDN
jgi:hypothetical protein